MIATDPTARTLLTFWFGTEEVSGPIAPVMSARWFRLDPAFDAELSTRFGADVDRASQGALSHWENTAPGALALVLLLDQLPRNLFRNDARAFASDALARETAERAITRGFDREVSPLARSFFYMPFEHAEDLTSQERSVTLHTALAQHAPTELAALANEIVRYARMHHDTIARFGRFPHRNAVLGRESTDAEREYLARGGGFTTTAP